MHLKTDRQALDCSGKPRAVNIPAGWYEIERIINPYDHRTNGLKTNWLVVKDTKRGGDESYWCKLTNTAQTDSNEFDVVIAEDLPPDTVLACSGKIDWVLEDAEVVCQKLLREFFATELREDYMIVDYLWTPNASRALGIGICKEIRINTGREENAPVGLRQLYPVFYVFNYIDPSKAASPDSGCCVNPTNKPYLSFEEAMAVVEQHIADALAGGKWVRFEQMLLLKRFAFNAIMKEVIKAASTIGR